MKRASASVYLTSLALVAALVGRAQDSKPLVPELLGVVYHLDSEKATLVPLERQPAHIVSKGATFLFGTYKRRVEVQGARSPVRFAAGQKLEFVVSTEQVQLYRLASKQKKREALLTSSTVLVVAERTKTNLSVMAIDMRPYGSAIKITPAESLTPGEYGFRIGNEMFCFGVDAPAPK